MKLAKPRQPSEHINVAQAARRAFIVVIDII
jgi:hypothetical protein